MMKKILLLLLIINFYTLTGQSIPASDGAPPENGGNRPCSLCAPTGWTRYATTDISNQTQGGGLNSSTNTNTSGMGLRWIDENDNVITIPAPPNGHTSYISLRDLGQQSINGNNIEENISTTITGLTPGAKYEVVIYAYTGRTESRSYEHNLYDDDGNLVYTDNNNNGIFDTGDVPTKATANNEVYSGTYIEEFDYQIEGQDRKTISMENSQNEWITVKAPFTATASDHTLFFYPGYDSGYLPASFTRNQDANGVSPYPLIQSVLLSIDLDAINDLPTADDDNATTPHNTPVTLSNVTSNDSDDNTDNETINVASVDLDPSTPGRQTSYTSPEGSWEVDDSGNVTFTPNDGFTGTAKIPYTVDDSFVQNGEPAPATSNTADLIVVVEAPVPVTLSYFNAQAQGNSVLLTWATETEVNNARFEIFKSVDGVDFEYLADVDSKADAQGNSTQELTYDYLDEDVNNASTVYYRLKQVDYDGQSEVFPVRQVTLNGQAQISVFPNPVVSGGTITVSGLEINSIAIFDVRGKEISRTEYSAEKSVELSSDQMQTGMYIMVINNEISKKIVIE